MPFHNFHWLLKMKNNNTSNLYSALEGHSKVLVFCLALQEIKIVIWLCKVAFSTNKRAWVCSELTTPQSDLMFCSGSVPVTPADPSDVKESWLERVGVLCWRSFSNLRFQMSTPAVKQPTHSQPTSQQSLSSEKPHGHDATTASPRTLQRQGSVPTPPDSAGWPLTLAHLLPVMFLLLPPVEGLFELIQSQCVLLLHHLLVISGTKRSCFTLIAWGLLQRCVRAAGLLVFILFISSERCNRSL